MHYLFSDRLGGVSQAPFESLNVGYHVGDNVLHVKTNRDILAKRLGVEKLVFMEQVHGDKVVVIHHGDEATRCDAMITNRLGIGLAVMVADCVPILLYDPKSEAIGVAHAGRVGSALRVAQKCAMALNEEFGSAFSDIQIFIGPSIGVCCYEVGKEATIGFESFLHVKDGRYFLDLQRFNVEAFLSMGILAEHITVSKSCSCCDESYFSYRRERTTGRFAGVICL